MNDMMPGAPLNWRKSSYSGNDPDKTNCVEVAFSPDGDGAYVRDSKDPEGGMASLPAASWRHFLAIAPKIRIPHAE
jgi:uncharacterized protein DUF397